MAPMDDLFERYKERLRRLFLVDDKSLSQVMDEMKTLNFRARYNSPVVKIR